MTEIQKGNLTEKQIPTKAEVILHKKLGYGVVDNLVTPEVFKPFQEFFTSREPQWNIDRKVLNPIVDPLGERGCDDRYNFQGTISLCDDAMQHILFCDPKVSEFQFRGDLLKQICKELFKVLNPLCLIRIKINITFNTHTVIEQAYHQDREGKNGEFDHMMNACFYLNTCDGYTRFKNEDGSLGAKVESVENRLVFFPNKLIHTGTTTTNAPARYVMNINYVPRRHCPFHDFLAIV